MIAAFLDGTSGHPGRWDGDEPDGRDDRDELRFRDVLLALVLAAVPWAPVLYLAASLLP